MEIETEDGEQGQYAWKGTQEADPGSSLKPEGYCRGHL